MSKLECIHVDTCLPDYWGGHHLPHVQIPIWRGMTMPEIKSAIRSELSQGAVMGNDENAFLLSADFVGPDNDKKARQVFSKACAAVNRMRPAKPGTRRFFLDLEETDGDCCDSVYAFFIFVECE